MLKLFDCNCAVGRRTDLSKGLWRVEDVLAEMDHVGIAEALVYDSTGRDYCPGEGNARILKETADQPRLHPCWVVMPEHTGEMPPGDKLVRQMLEAGVRVARAFPTTQNFRLDGVGGRRLLGAMAEARIPLLVDMEQISWPIAEKLAGDYPDLPLILSNVGYRCGRLLFALLEAFENVYFETSSYEVHRGLEAAGKTFGAGRIVFGSGMPHRAPSSAVSMVRYAMLDDEALAAIVGGNLRALMERAGQ